MNGPTDVKLELNLASLLLQARNVFAMFRIYLYIFVSLYPHRSIFYSFLSVGPVPGGRSFRSHVLHLLLVVMKKMENMHFICKLRAFLCFI